MVTVEDRDDLNAFVIEVINDAIGAHEDALEMFTPLLSHDRLLSRVALRYACSRRVTFDPAAWRRGARVVGRKRRDP